MADLFISDLHLSPARPQTVDRFAAFLAGHAAAGTRLFVLGDLFDYWVGDDETDSSFAQRVIAPLRAAAERGSMAHFMHGNRDFLVGERCLGAMGARLIPDPWVIETAGVRTLLAHGDAYCTLDPDYQRFRTQVRSFAWQQSFLAKPLSERHAIAAGLRAQSEANKKAKDPIAMDVAPDAIVAAMRASACTRLIHGHTHRPARHALTVDEIACERWVLAEWDGAGAFLRCDRRGCEAIAVPTEND